MKPVVVTAPESKISSKNVQQICGSKVAFAAILADRSVVTWGAKYCVGDSSRVQGQLQNVQQICSASYDFAAILADRSVVTWGAKFCGGDSSRVQGQLQNVQQICSTSYAFAPFWQIEAWWPGAMKPVVVTAPESKISSKMFSRSVAQRLLLLPLWQIEAWWPGALNIVLGTAPESKVSYRMFSRFVAQAMILLPFWQIEAWWPGAMKPVVVTAPESKISCGMYSRFVGRTLLLLPFWQIEAWWPGAMQPVVAHGWGKGWVRMSRLLTLQDGSGGFEFVGNAFPIDPVPQNIAFPTCICCMLLSACLVWIWSWIRCGVSQRDRRQAYLKKVLTSNRLSFILFCGTFFSREMTNVKQSVRIYNSSKMFSRSVAQTLLSLPFWQMDVLWPGAIQRMVVTAPQSKLSLATCSWSGEKIS